jgi:cytidylate kinase
MNAIQSLSHLPDSLQRQVRHWEEKVRQRAASGAAKPGFTIALAREAGTQGIEVAREAGQRLGWPVYDHELLEMIAREMGLRVSLLESVDEKRVGVIQEAVAEFMEAFATVRRVSEGAYVKHLVETVLALGSHGECVIVGRGAPHILPRDTTLRVRLIAALEERVAAMSRNHKMSLDQARKEVTRLDEERRAFVRSHFQQDPADPHHYDLVLNAGRFSVPECAALIVDGVRQLQAKAASTM